MITKKEIFGLVKLIKENKNSTESLKKYYVGENVKFGVCQSNVLSEYYKDDLIVFTTQQLENLEKINVENILYFLND
jgi:hypothetical protein